LAVQRRFISKNIFHDAIAIGGDPELAGLWVVINTKSLTLVFCIWLFWGWGFGLL